MNKYGFPDLMKIREIEKEKVVEGALLRNFVEYCLNLGINPSEDRHGEYQDVEHLSSCKYADFQARRNEWIEFAWDCINRIKTKMTSRHLSSVIQWNKHALCAFETGPVFIRKRKSYLLPSFGNFAYINGWNQEKIQGIFHEFVERDVIILIDNYWDHFNGNQTIPFFKGNRAIVEQIQKLSRKLGNQYQEIICNEKVYPVTSIPADTSQIRNEKMDTGIRSNLYERLCRELDPFFGKSIIDQKTKITYRSENKLGYPKKRELDMISLFKPSSTSITLVKFRIYPYILASNQSLISPDEIILNLPVDSIIINQERENPHPAEIFIAGKFSNEHEIERFINLIGRKESPRDN
jgi:hypothetical protein